MSVQVLQKSQVFGVGCDLWIIPDTDKSPYLRKLDWYLNFQITRAHQHKSESLSPQLLSITSENALPDFNVRLKKSSSLMLAARNGLPAQTLIEIPTSTEWVAEIHETWAALKNPTLKVFLPIDLSPEDFKKKWSAIDKNNNSFEISLVPATP